MKFLIQGEKLTRYEKIMVMLHTIKILIGATGVTLVVYNQLHLR
jgi:hypothetical protein